MLILVGKSPTTIARDHPHENVGILVSPRRPYDAAKAATLGLPWAADNDCFNGGLDEPKFRNMLQRAQGHEGCMFVCAPDVVGDAEETLRMFPAWRNVIRAHGLPVALVAQDGLVPNDVPWGSIEALFIGGTTEWKLSEASYSLVQAAKEHGKIVHMGRVNSRKRIRLALAWGCDSVDGTSTVMFTDTHLPWQLEMVKDHDNTGR